MRANPEHKLQCAVREYLLFALPETIEWTASAVGVNLGIHSATKLKAAGVRRGWPDLQFLFPNGVTYYIELKAGASLSKEQKAFRDRCGPHGIFAVAKSVDDVEATLRAWGAPLRATTDLKPFLGDLNNSAKLFDDIAD